MKKKVYLALSLCVLLVLALSVTVVSAADGGSTQKNDPFSLLASAEPMVKGGLLGQDVKFNTSDFSQALGTTDIDAITVTTLPDSRDGILKLSGMRVGTGQTIRAEYLHLLTFTPADENVREASFEFTCGDFACGAVMSCRIRIAESMNKAPSVNEAESAVNVSTQAGVSVYGTLVGEDPEDDALTYIVTAYPEKGSLKMTDAHTGDFCYTPEEGYRGTDSFRYVVRDFYGNYSRENTVTLKISAREIDLDYADMEGHAAYNAALTAAANRWMLGTLSGDGMYFAPNETVSRGDFVAMVMKAAGIAPIKNLTDTCFDDNGEIPASVRSYVATAQEKGYVIGSFDGSSLKFEANRPVTRAEAAMIVSRIVSLDKPTIAPVFSDGDSIPVWAKDAIESAFGAGLLGVTGEGIAASAPLTRADAAMMLKALSELVE